MPTAAATSQNAGPRTRRTWLSQSRQKPCRVSTVGRMPPGPVEVANASRSAAPMLSVGTPLSTTTAAYA